MTPFRTKKTFATSLALVAIFLAHSQGAHAEDATPAQAVPSDTRPFPLFAVSARGGMLLAPKLGDGLDGSPDVEIGWMSTVSAIYRPRREYEIGFDLSYLTATQTVDKATLADPYNGNVPPTVAVNGGNSANLHLATEGPAAGLHVAIQGGDRFIYGARLGLGVYFGFWRQDWTSVVFVGNSAGDSRYPTYSFAAYAHIAPGLNIGYRLTQHLTASLGADLQLLLPVMPTTRSAFRPQGGQTPGDRSCPSSVQPLISATTFLISRVGVDFEMDRLRRIQAVCERRSFGVA